MWTVPTVHYAMGFHQVHTLGPLHCLPGLLPVSYWPRNSSDLTHEAHRNCSRKDTEKLFLLPPQISPNSSAEQLGTHSPTTQARVHSNLFWRAVFSRQLKEKNACFLLLGQNKYNSELLFYHRRPGKTEWLIFHPAIVEYTKHSSAMLLLSQLSPGWGGIGCEVLTVGLASSAPHQSILPPPLWTLSTSFKGKGMRRGSKTRTG